MSAPPTTLLADLAAGHVEIRELLDRLEREPEHRVVLAEELSQVLARHRCSAMESVLEMVARRGSEDHDQQVRLLMCATRGVNQLTDRLRMPAGDPDHVRNAVAGLRGLVYEHERLELELAVAALTDAPPR